MLLNLFVASRIQKALPREVGGFLLRVFWWTVIVRYLLAVALSAYAASSTFAGLFWGDSNTYDAGGYGLALLWRGETIGTTVGKDIVGRYGYYYFVAAVYYFFGRNQLLVQFLNGTIGALTVVVIHAIA